MRHKLNLDLATLDNGFTMLVYGAYGTGKTYLAGSFLQAHAANGRVHYLNVKGEDGYLTLAPLGLGEVGETVDSYEDLRAALDDLAKDPPLALAVDSLVPIGLMSMSHSLKATGAPDPTRMAQKFEWGSVHHDMRQLVQSLRRSARYVLATCPANLDAVEFSKHLDAPRIIAPSLYGQQAVDAQGWFDFVGYLKMELVGTNSIRKVVFRPNSEARTRFRSPLPPPDVTLPVGPGGWAAVTASLQKAMSPSTKEPTR